MGTRSGSVYLPPLKSAPLLRGERVHNRRLHRDEVDELRTLVATDGLRRVAAPFGHRRPPAEWSTAHGQGAQEAPMQDHQQHPILSVIGGDGAPVEELVTEALEDVAATAERGLRNLSGASSHALRFLQTVSEQARLVASSAASPGPPARLSETR